MTHDTRITRITTWQGTRRRFGIGAAGAAVSALALARGGLAQSGATPAPATPPAATPGGASGNGAYLLVADQSAARIEIYSVPDLEQTGALDGVGFGAHAGGFLLEDGRVLFADTVNEEIVALTVGADGTPAITDRVAARLGGAAAWITVSPDLTRLVVTSLIEDSDVQFVNVVDLATFDNTALEFTMAEPEELHAWLLGDPASLYVAVGGRIDSYRFAGLAGGETEPLASVQVELGSHGGATDAVTSRIFYTTAPGTGFEVLDVSGGTAEYLAQVPWDVGGLSGGRNARPRVTLDGRHIFGVMTPGLEDPTVWAETEVSNHVTSLDDLAAVRLPVAAGNFGYRYGISARYALWAGYGADGGSAYLLDADATSDTFGTAVATIPIDLPTGAATPGEDFAGSETYNTAITSDGRYGLVSINGDSRVIVLDLERREQIGETAIGVALSGYTGYLMVVESGRSPVDLWAR